MTQTLITEIVELCIIPLIAILVRYLLIYTEIKSKEIQSKIDNDTANKYIQMVTDTVSKCVIATNQTYVNSLKSAGTFDEAAQQEAFKMTYEAIVAILTEEAQTYLTSIYGDLTLYLTQCIEAEVNENRWFSAYTGK